MAGAKDKSKLGYRILLGAVVLVLGGSMLLYLVPQSPVSGEISTDTLAKIGDESVSVQDVRQQLNQIEQRNPNMKPLESLYAQQILKQLVFEKEIEYEAKRLGIAVSDQERADRINPRGLRKEQVEISCARSARGALRACGRKPDSPERASLR